MSEKREIILTDETRKLIAKAMNLCYSDKTPRTSYEWKLRYLSFGGKYSNEVSTAFKEFRISENGYKIGIRPAKFGEKYYYDFKEPVYYKKINLYNNIKKNSGKDEDLKDKEKMYALHDIDECVRTLLADGYVVKKKKKFYFKIGWF